MRVFIAIDVPEAYKEALGPELQRGQRQAPYYRWVRPDTLHLTLRFVGETDGETVGKLDSFLRTITFPKFTVKPRGLGIFGPKAHPHVLWIGVDHDGVQATSALSSQITTGVMGMGIRIKDRSLPMIPHITVGVRGVPDDRLPEEIPRYPEELLAVVRVLPTWEVDEFQLFESYLEQGGSGASSTRYATLGRYRLT